MFMCTAPKRNSRKYDGGRMICIPVKFLFICRPTYKGKDDGIDHLHPATPLMKV